MYRSQSQAVSDAELEAWMYGKPIAQPVWRDEHYRMPLPESFSGLLALGGFFLGLFNRHYFQSTREVITQGDQS